MSDGPVSARVTLKLATSADGRIALANGASRWITGPEARAAVHEMRANHDVILTGAGTIIADDPQLTARPDGAQAARQPARAILDTRLRTPANARLFEEGGAVIAYHAEADDSRAEALAAAGAEIVRLAQDADGRPAFAAALDDLARRGLTRVMVEAGAGVATSALRSGRVDRIDWFRAPVVLGGDARPVVAALGLETLADAPRFRRVDVRACGADLHEVYERDAS
ncbi:riboflavin biosynthesis protein RibD [Marinicauda salina]|uniref:Riboflavin biosynthesis protein RibD n=1 Tax=Marinicauda salina TaxID=2135793 RepID=A0A2U2BVD0_9PROT|nr:RibD family protein [Marinicauda salina]PWE17986.1 riboflavin biosynthesis protein RibD [Marinicauda salina]